MTDCFTYTVREETMQHDSKGEALSYHEMEMAAIPEASSCLLVCSHIDDQDVLRVTITPWRFPDNRRLELLRLLVEMLSETSKPLPTATQILQHVAEHRNQRQQNEQVLDSGSEARDDNEDEARDTVPFPSVPEATFPSLSSACLDDFQTDEHEIKHSMSDEKSED